MKIETTNHQVTIHSIMYNRKQVAKVMVMQSTTDPRDISVVDTVMDLTWYDNNWEEFNTYTQELKASLMSQPEEDEVETQ